MLNPAHQQNKILDTILSTHCTMMYMYQFLIWISIYHCTLYTASSWFFLFSFFTYMYLSSIYITPIKCFFIKYNQVALANTGRPPTQSYYNPYSTKYGFAVITLLARLQNLQEHIADYQFLKVWITKLDLDIRKICRQWTLIWLHIYKRAIVGKNTSHPTMAEDTESTINGPTSTFGTCFMKKIHKNCFTLSFAYCQHTF